LIFHQQSKLSINTDCNRYTKDELMNLSTTAYNPFVAALNAAIAELTSAQAQRYYALKSQKDLQNSLDSALTLIGWIYQVSEKVYQLGALSRAWCDEMVADSQQEPIPSSMVLCPAAAPVALLPAAQPQTIRLPGSLASSGVAIVTPAPADTAPVSVLEIKVEPESAVAETVAPPPFKSTPKTGQRRSTSTAKKQPPATGGKSRRKVNTP
jgi:hypothetical protein